MWITRIMVTWGIITVLVGFIHTSRQFYVIRFLLGAARPVSSWCDRLSHALV